MTVRVYRWDDASAPTLTGQFGSLITLLDAGGGYAPRGFVHIGAPDDIPSAVVFALTTPSHRLFAGV